MDEALPLYLAGEFRQTPETRPVHSPHDGTLVGRACLAGAAEVEEALAGAWGARGPLARLSTGERSRALARLARALEAGREAMAALIRDEAGKPVRLARQEVDRAVRTLDLAAAEAERLGGEVLPLDSTEAERGRTGLVRRFPVGVVLGITPFNFPLNLALHKLGPALAAGCPIVLKTADQTPLTLLRLAEEVHRLGLPAGAVSVLSCEVPRAEAMVRDDRVALLSFTGSARVGFHLKAVAGKKRVLLELGGNAAVYVDRSADLGLAARRVAFGAMAYAGQVCISVQRVYVHGAVHEAFRGRLLAEVARLARGDPRDPEVVVGPLISEAAALRVEALVEEALAAGARVLCGGRREGRHYEPTILEGCPARARVVREEAFGPVAVLEPVDGAAAGFAAINDSDYGLQAGVFTNDLQQLLQAHETLEVGAVLHDEVPTWRHDAMPYGGVKDSGRGREGLRYAMEAMTEPRLLVLRRS
ncbi:MAG: aldehyde dehydrogenase family protein [Planctomycetes bacterium]|nr:aldehyde dehydrogenase family protein [Planctomycetota bacterium]